MISKSSV